MNVTLIVCGVATLGLVPVHVFGGGRDCLAPMREAQFDAVARETLHVCWHAVTAMLALGGGTLLWAGAVGGAAGMGAALLVSALHLCFAALFIAIGRASGIDGAWFKLGQWIAVLPLGVAGVVACVV